MKIAFIHQDQKIKTGANYINGLISDKLKEFEVDVRHFYPKVTLVDTPHHMKGFNNILFFFSLLERKNEILSCDIIQGTTYTPLAFLPFHTPIVSHFGSTTTGFIRATPKFKNIENPLQKIWRELKRASIIYELNLKTRRPLHDIADMEKLVAKKATAIIATSKIVKTDLIADGIDESKIHIIHNAIEDFWFDPIDTTFAPPELVYLGRIGQDVFTMKLKGLDRLIYAYRSFPKIPKLTIAMTGNKKLSTWLKTQIESNSVQINLFKPEIKNQLSNRRGSILIVPSRYEGFCLSMIEGMSQGLIPVAFPIGVAPEIIQSGDNGYLVNTIEEMNEKIDLIISNESLRRQLSDNAQKTAELFRSNNMAIKMIDVYNAIKKPDKYAMYKKVIRHGLRLK